MMNNRNMPANQESITSCNDGSLVSGDDISAHSGLTKLEYAAIAAMQGLLSNPTDNEYFASIELLAIKHANALFDELEKEQ